MSYIIRYFDTHETYLPSLMTQIIHSYIIVFFTSFCGPRAAMIVVLIICNEALVYETNNVLLEFVNSRNSVLVVI